MGAVETGGSMLAYSIGLVVFGFGSYMIINNIGNKMVDAVKSRVMSA
tara:strand:- start:452 stop:592 length:141 start_codon:yes stop_codon:yes gene_type:complete